MTADETLTRVIGDVGYMRGLLRQWAGRTSGAQLLQFNQKGDETAGSTRGESKLNAACASRTDENDMTSRPLDDRNEKMMRDSIVLMHNATG
jgi:hypothetical protein